MFRYLNQIEKKIIKKSLGTISSNLVSNFSELENNFFINVKKRTLPNIFPKIYLLSDELKNLLKKLRNTESISLGGLYFGFIKRGKFYLSLEGTEFLYNNSLISDLKHLYVNKRGEKSVLYGNNILKNMLIKKSHEFGEKDFILVFNDKNEIIAISRATVGSDQVQNLKAEDLIAINLSDKGIYLREKQ